jgi:hypothetical protein
MSVDAMTRLAAVNPVLDPPAVESPERLRCLVEDDALALDLGAGPGERSRRVSRDSRTRRRALVAIALCAGASAISVLLGSGSTGPGVNVAAAAYAATSPRAGIVEALFLTRIFRGSEAGGTLRERQWLDSAKGLRREQYSTTGPDGDTHETHVLEFVSAPGRLESWSAGREANVVDRVRSRGASGVSVAFGDTYLSGIEGIDLYRQFYRRGLMGLVGRERHQGRVLWKLESRPSGYADANGHFFRVPAHTKLIVLVDPKTSLPVAERQIDTALPGRPTLVESDLLSYRHYVGESEGSLFDLAAQHPDARVHTGGARSPKFVRAPAHRHTGESGEPRRP